ncbi:hypothetical protein HDU78_006168 [Chytriomyces hyalinus]|nr:hypothetical protein HDU78_006168 [Chytriomyces hyalinus]
MLPIEVAHGILLLIAHSDVTSLSVFARVCRSWHSIFTRSIPSIESVLLAQYSYSHLDRDVKSTMKTYKNWINFKPEHEVFDPALQSPMERPVAIKGCVLDADTSVFVTSSSGGVVTCFALSGSYPSSRVWNVRLDQLDSDLHLGMVSCLAVSAKLDRVVVGWYGEAIVLLELSNGDLVSTPYVAHSNSVLCVCVDEISGVVLSGGAEGIIAAYDLASDAVLGTSLQDVGRILDIQCNGSVMAVSSSEPQISIWTQNQSRELAFPYTLIRSMTLPELCPSVTLTTHNIVLISNTFAAGYVIPQKEFMSGAHDVCQKHDIPFQPGMKSVCHIGGTGTRWNNCFVIGEGDLFVFWNAEVADSMKSFCPAVKRMHGAGIPMLRSRTLVCVVGGKYLVAWSGVLRVFEF